jgi:hypothetical protein
MRCEGDEGYRYLSLASIVLTSVRNGTRSLLHVRAWWFSVLPAVFSQLVMVILKSLPPRGQLRFSFHSLLGERNLGFQLLQLVT